MGMSPDEIRSYARGFEAALGDRVPTKKSVRELVEMIANMETETVVPQIIYVGGATPRRPWWPVWYTESTATSGKLDLEVDAYNIGHAAGTQAAKKTSRVRQVAEAIVGD